MNERIKELARKAGISILYEYDGYDGHAGVANFDDIEKFAELIVKECMKLNHDHFSDEDPYSIDSLYRYHFGVEE